jgi:uracil-DNA glycosylase family 4
MRSNRLEQGGILLIGEAPGRNEDEAGLPFIGRAGQRLNEALDDHADVPYQIANAVCCRPSNNRTPDEFEVEDCLFHLRLLISTLQPRILVCLGRVAAFALYTLFHNQSVFDGERFKLIGPISAARSEVHTIQMTDRVMRSWVVTWHPSYVMKPWNKDKIGPHFNEDIKMAFDYWRKWYG